MTFFNTHSHLTGKTGDYQSPESMLWAHNAAMQICARRQQSVAVHVKAKWEVRLT